MNDGNCIRDIGAHGEMAGSLTTIDTRLLRGETDAWLFVFFTPGNDALAEKLRP